MQWFAQGVTFVSNLFASSKNQSASSSGGASLDAPASAAASTLISKSSPLAGAAILKVLRNPAMTTKDALFGDMDYNGERISVTMERTAVAIPEGTYRAHKEISPHFGFATPHLQVPGRTYIEIHPANYPAQLEGCIAVGTTIDNDSLDSSDAAFQKLMAILPQEFTVIVSSNH